MKINKLVLYWGKEKRDLLISFQSYHLGYIWEFYLPSEFIFQKFTEILSDKQLEKTLGTLSTPKYGKKCDFYFNRFTFLPFKIQNNIKNFITNINSKVPIKWCFLWTIIKFSDNMIIFFPIK